MANLAYKTPSEQTHINDELLSMVFPNLFAYLVLPELKTAAVRAIRGWHATCRRDRIPFYDFVFNTFSGQRVPLAESVETLREWPLDMIEWTVDNRSREDVQVERRPGTDDEHLTRILPRSEMGLVMWDQDPYKSMIGRGGQREDKPTDWLLAYWMGRYWGCLTPTPLSEPGDHRFLTSSPRPSRAMRSSRNVRKLTFGSQTRAALASLMCRLLLDTGREPEAELCYQSRTSGKLGLAPGRAVRGEIGANLVRHSVIGVNDGTE